MDAKRHTEALDRLDAAADPAALRFDGGGELRGRVAVLPAAYNPPTVAHLALIERALAVAGVDAAGALLSTRNVDKAVHGASLADRVEMLLAAHDTGAGYAVLATNAARLADQAVALRAAFPGAEFDFVVGYDTLVRLFEPRYYDDMHGTLRAFLGRHRVIAANRGEAGPEAVAAFLHREDVAHYREAVVVVELELSHADVSSTRARESAASGEDAAAVPAAVARYIARRGLYQGGAAGAHVTRL